MTEEVPPENIQNPEIVSVNPDRIILSFALGGNSLLAAGLFIAELGDLPAGRSAVLATMATLEGLGAVIAWRRAFTTN